MRASDQTVLALGNRVVTHNSRYAVTHDESTATVWTLKIKSVRESDRGCYMCQINTTPMQKQLGCVDIYLPPDISDEESSSDLTIKEGENASLYCNAHGHPTPRITWRRNDGAPIWLSSIPSNSNYDNGLNSSGNSNKSKNITTNIRGTTTIKTMNAYTRVATQIKVDTFSGNYLNLSNVQREQMGAYLCIASNDIPPAISKRVVLNVKFAPNVTTPRTLFGSYVDSDVTIECTVEAFPLAVNYWIKGTKSLKAYDIDKYYNANSMNHNSIGTGIVTQMPTTGTKDEIISLSEKYEIQEEKISSYKSKILLKIKNFSEADDGTYTCISTNTLGKANKTIRIYGT
uniref:CSON004957 protein n=1 Tax=Culicoides sonorensis TaxID=179676 RepID=A0A336MTJ8_CULSO